jgi:protein phosphatase
LPLAVTALDQAPQIPEISSLLESYEQRREAAVRYVEAYRQYCWTVHSLADLELAPFHLLASEGGVHSGKDHVWHMETLAEICRADSELLLATPYRVIDLTNAEDQTKGIQWWEELTARGGEGMVVKPLEFVSKVKRVWHNQP